MATKRSIFKIIIDERHDDIEKMEKSINNYLMSDHSIYRFTYSQSLQINRDIKHIAAMALIINESTVPSEIANQEMYHMGSSFCDSVEAKAVFLYVYLNGFSQACPPLWFNPQVAPMYVQPQPIYPHPSQPTCNQNDDVRYRNAGLREEIRKHFYGPECSTEMNAKGQNPTNTNVTM